MTTMANDAARRIAIDGPYQSENFSIAAISIPVV